MFPAHAGLNRKVLWSAQAGTGRLRVPRACGAEPVGGDHSGRAVRVFPAHAGLNRKPKVQPGASYAPGVPRACGAEPRGAVARGPAALIIVFPAHAGLNRPQPRMYRRYRFDVFPAHAGLNRKVAFQLCGRNLPGVFPAHAGLNRDGYSTTRSSIQIVFPAHAGLNRAASISVGP